MRAELLRLKTKNKPPKPNVQKTEKLWKDLLKGIISPKFHECFGHDPVSSERNHLKSLPKILRIWTLDTLNYLESP